MYMMRFASESSFAATHAAAKDPVNCDTFHVTPRSISVFDGVAKNKDGDVSAREAARAVAETIERDATPLEAIVTYADEAARNKSFGSTTVALGRLSLSGTFEFHHRGDSRVYRFNSSDGLQCLTQDDAAYVDERGALIDPRTNQRRYRDIQADLASISRHRDMHDKPELQQQFMNRHCITAALGNFPNDSSVLDRRAGSVPLRPGDIFLATTDGIHDNLVDQEIETICLDALLMALLRKTASPFQIARFTAQRLVDQARARRNDDYHIRSKDDDLTAAVLVTPQR